MPEPITIALGATGAAAQTVPKVTSYATSHMREGRLFKARQLSRRAIELIKPLEHLMEPDTRAEWVELVTNYNTLKENVEASRELPEGTALIMGLRLKFRRAVSGPHELVDAARELLRWADTKSNKILLEGYILTEVTMAPDSSDSTVNVVPGNTAHDSSVAPGSANSASGSPGGLPSSPAGSPQAETSPRGTVIERSFQVNLLVINAQGREVIRS